MAKILVVDDDPVARKLVVALLGHDGHLTIEAGDGRDGLEAARAEKPQLVISDILMPSMDGHEFVRQLHADPSLCGTPVIFYTAHFHQREAATVAQTYRIARVLVKPCPAADLLQAVEQVLAGISESDVADRVEDVGHQQLILIANTLAQKADLLRAANARFSAFGELIVELAREHDPQRLVDRVCVGARKLFGSRYAVAAMGDQASERGLLFANSGVDFADRQATPPDLNSGCLGAVLSTGRPWRISDAADQEMISGLPSVYPLAEAFLAVPLTTSTNVLGWLCLADKIGADSFDVEDEQLLLLLGALFGPAYEQGAQTLSLRQRVAQLEAELLQRRAADGTELQRGERRLSH
jgi:CheY-like chemotaxis protein